MTSTTRLIRDIMMFAQCDRSEARKIEDYLLIYECPDFSECTQKQYDNAIQQAIVGYRVKSQGEA